MTVPTTLPKITIVTPSFNQAHYLDATCRSIVSQEYPNLEWFVCDGGSKDNSVEVIKRYEPHIAWWVSEKDRGSSHALNKGYERATGDVFCYVNSDDTLEPGCLHYVAKQFADAKTDWVVGWAKYFQDDGDEWYYVPKPTERPIDWIVSNPVPQIASFWRTNVREKVGLFNEAVHWSFDYEYWLRMYFKAGVRPKIVRRCMGGFRLQPNSKTVSRPQNFALENEALLKEFVPMLPPEQRARLRHEQQKKKVRAVQDKAWFALKMGDAKTARKHALDAIAERFTSLDAWKVAYCAWRGY